MLLVYTGHSGLLEIGNEISKRLTYVWTLSCFNGDGRGTSTRHDLMIRCCWRPILVFAEGSSVPLRSSMMRSSRKIGKRRSTTTSSP